MALYWKCPTAAELSGTGHLVSDYMKWNQPNVEVWDEHWDALMLFRENATQWRVGPGGMTGLDYNIFHGMMDRRGIIGEAFEQMMDDIRVIEDAALVQMNLES